MQWDFTTEAFRDPPEVREENINEIEGHALAELLRRELGAKGFACGEIWPEDHGWVFRIETPDAPWLCVASLDPLHDEEERDAAREMFAIVQLNKMRNLWDRLLGRHRMRDDEAVPAALTSILAAQRDLRPRVYR